MPHLPKLAISIGEPAGIGPDLIIKFISNSKNRIKNFILIAFCDSNLIYQRAKDLNINIEIININTSDIQNLSPAPFNSLYIIDNIKPRDINYIPSLLNNNNTAENTLNYLNQAALACLDNHCDALVTCPIQKSNINYIQKDFTGHTEYLENICDKYFNTKYKSVMLLTSNKLKVALVTTHIPVYKIPENITQEKIINIATILNQDLITKFKINNPHILITGLNPHAGENGKLGTEELDIIIPAIEKLKANNINISGPYAADTVFNQKITQSDVILAMYHDQGLTGFKAVSFNDSANITLGLPIIRTSVDHGTALGLAGTGNINLSSFEFSIQSAIDIVMNNN